MKRRIFTDEHELFRESVQSFLTREVAPHYDQWQRDKIVPRHVWQAAGREGFLCPTASPEFDGAGADFGYALVINEEIFERGFPGVLLSLHSDIVFPYLEKYATPELKARLLKRAVRGEAILAVAMTEPGAGSDLARITTRAEDRGDNLVLSGSKTFISNGQLADAVVVAARTEPGTTGPKGISLLVVEAGMAGFARGRNLEKIGLHAQDTSELFFQDCVIPKSHILGERGCGFAYLMEGLQQERLVLASGSLAAARGALRETVRYVRERQIFGRPLAEFQNTRFTLAEIQTEITIGESFLDDLCERHMRGEKLSQEVAMAKTWMSDMAFRATDRCLQLFGGYGYMVEYPISRFFVDTRVHRIFAGANEVMKDIIAKGMGL